jgi:hypothetical protein
MEVRIAAFVVAMVIFVIIDRMVLPIKTAAEPAAEQQPT